LTERITSPLRRMSEAAHAFASGDFEVKVPVRGNDEVAELADSFNQMAESLRNLETMRSSFMANVSHDLRTPMTTIAGFVDSILAGAIAEEDQPRYLGIISEEVKRLSRLVSLTLDISRIQAGDRKFVMAPFDICETARLILISFEQKIDAKRLEVLFDADEDNMTVYADRDAIYQILYNICDNAVKFSREGGRLEIAVRNRRDLKKVQVTVLNEGQGIHAEDIPYIFDQFYKGDKSRGLDKSGVGLGMFISKAIIDAHKEEIWVHSEYGKNCEFGFTISAKPVHAKGNEREWLS
jgi:signal transduction histidine kinase